MMRMNISVADELRASMEAFDEKVNWSAIAAAAFREEVARQNRLAAINDDVKRRLAATEEEDEIEIEKEGHKAGYDWAVSSARKVALRRLAKIVDNVDCNTPPNFIAGVIAKDESYRWSDLPELGDEPDEVDLEMGWLVGFVRGAVEVLDAA